MYVRLDDSVRPSYFISYAREQERAARTIARSLAGVATTVWQDITNLAVGDNWPRTVQAAIQHCDELILVLCNASVASPVVRAEVEEAQRAGKLVRPLIVESLGEPARKSIAYIAERIHYLDTIRDPDGEQLRAFLELGSRRRAQEAQSFDDLGSRELKVVAARGIWPPFDDTFIRLGARLGSLHAKLERLLDSYPPSSSLWLNAGLAACLAGDWERGVQLLEAYARAANTLAGWYFLAMHLPRQRPLHRLDIDLCGRIEEAASRAAALGVNSLVLLLQVFIDGGCSNRRARRWTDFQAFLDAERGQPEFRSEYLRLYSCLRASVDGLDELKGRVLAMLREKANARR